MIPFSNSGSISLYLCEIGRELYGCDIPPRPTRSECQKGLSQDPSVHELEFTSMTPSNDNHWPTLISFDYFLSLFVLSLIFSFASTQPEDIACTHPRRVNDL